jgi:hypothetical protein
MKPDYSGLARGQLEAPFWCGPVIEACNGQEDNCFYRRGSQTLERAGEKQLRQGDVIVPGPEVIHAIAEPTRTRLIRDPRLRWRLAQFRDRSVWNPFTFDERLYDIKLISDYAPELMDQARN